MRFIWLDKRQRNRENRDGCADSRGKVHQLVSSNGEMSCKPVLLLHKYRNMLLLLLLLLLYQIGFSGSTITSPFKHQSPFVLQVEVRELPTVYSDQEETDTRVGLYLHYATALGYKNAVV